MPYELTFDGLPAGYSLSAAKKGEQVSVGVRGFLSSEDGDLFITFLEGLPSELLARARVPVRPSMVDRMVAVIRRDKTATLYVNEIELRARALTKRSLKAGERVSRNDIADIDRLELPGIQVPADAGVVVVFSVGWRKGLFYDLVPLSPSHGTPRDYDLETRLGQFYRYMLFQHACKISHDEWKALVAASWFPFAALKATTVEEMIAHVRNGWNVDDLLAKVAEEVVSLAPAFRERWRASAFFSDHYDVLWAGFERYEAGDNVSAISILTPKVEGILRTFALASGSRDLTDHGLTNSAVERLQQGDPDSLLFPRRFRKYLNSLHFRPFAPEKPEGMSRHTLAHGVAPTETFTQKQALITILVIDQLSFFLRGRQERTAAIGGKPIS